MNTETITRIMPFSALKQTSIEHEDEKAIFLSYYDGSPVMKQVTQMITSFLIIVKNEDKEYQPVALFHRNKIYDISIRNNFSYRNNIHLYDAITIYYESKNPNVKYFVRFNDNATPMSVGVSYFSNVRILYMFGDMKPRFISDKNSLNMTKGVESKVLRSSMIRTKNCTPNDIGIKSLAIKKTTNLSSIVFDNEVLSHINDRLYYINNMINIVNHVEEISWKPETNETTWQ